MRTLSAIGNSAIRRDDLAAVLNGRRDSVDLRKSQEAEIEPLHAIPRTREVILTPPKTPELPFEEREFSRRGVLKTAMAGAAMLTAAVLEPLFKIAEANDRVPGEHHFTPQNIAKLKIDTTNELLALAEKHGYLPTETQNSEFSYSKFKDVADRASVRDLRQYFRAIEMLRNDGYFDSNRKMEEVHQILSNTPEIAPLKKLLFTALGARNDSKVVHGITKDEFFSMLKDHLSNNYKFPYNDDSVGKRMIESFEKDLSQLIDYSLQKRGLSGEFRSVAKK
ncbi:MAG: hypothetical protein O3C63_03775 [Cyanobacteria bacterium]|nr:hypothetical protein [Cyanobacteriota bacterium]